MGTPLNEHSLQVHGGGVCCEDFRFWCWVCWLLLLLLLLRQQSVVARQLVWLFSCFLHVWVIFHLFIKTKSNWETLGREDETGTISNMASRMIYNWKIVQGTKFLAADVERVSGTVYSLATARGSSRLLHAHSDSRSVSHLLLVSLNWILVVPSWM
jgi:hypothetical protein